MVSPSSTHFSPLQVAEIEVVYFISIESEDVTASLFMITVEPGDEILSIATLRREDSVDTTSCDEGDGIFVNDMVDSKLTVTIDTCTLEHSSDFAVGLRLRGYDGRLLR